MTSRASAVRIGTVDRSDRRAWFLVLALLIPCALWALVTAPGGFQAALAPASSPHVTDDFGLFYTTTECLVSRPCDPYAPRNFNPPHAHLLLTPLLLVTRTHAFLFFLGLNALAIVWIAFRLARSVLPWPVSAWAIAALGVGVSSLTDILLTTGQIYPLLGAGVIEAWLSWRDRRWTRAAVIMGVLISIKPIFALPALWMLRQRPATWRPLAVGCAVPFAIGMLVFGVSPYVGYFRVMSGVAVQGSGLDGSLWSTARRMLAPHGTDRVVSDHPIAPLWSAPWLVLPLWIGLSVLFVLDLVNWTRRTPLDAAWVGLLSAMLLISPKGWVYMGWVVIGPAMILWWRTRSWGLVTAAALFLVPLTVARNASGTVSSALLGSLYTWAWFAIYLGGRSGRHRDYRRTLAPATIGSQSTEPAAVGLSHR
jgi:glycosyl transferase family 87